MALDTTIETRRNEINNISNDIGNERQLNEEARLGMRDKQFEMLQKQIEKQKSLYDNKSLDTMSNLYA